MTDEQNQRPSQPGGSRISGLELARIALITTTVAMAVVAFGLLLWKASNVVLIVFGAVLFAIFLTSIGGWIASHTRMGKRMGVVTTIILLAGLIGTGAYFLAPRIADQFDELSRTIPSSVEQLRTQLEQYEWGQWLMARLPKAEQLMSPSAAAKRAGVFFSSLFGGVTAILVILFAGIFMAFNPAVYRGAIVRLVPPARRSRADEILIALESTMAWWLVGRFFEMIVVGSLTWLGLTLLDVPLALTLGLIAGLLSFIPYVGPVLSAVPAILLALTIDPSKALHVVLLYVAIQAVESNLITPLIEKKTVWLPPALTIVMQVLFGVLFGPLGVLFATPITATFIVLAKMLYIEDLLGEQVEVSRAI